MKLCNNLFFCTVIGVFLSSSLMSQDQSMIRDIVIPATNEHDTIKFGLMVPPSYKESGRKYPVIYYLHGLNGYYSDWNAQEVAEFLTLYMKDEVITECIVVFPDGGEGFWCNHYDEDPLLEDEIIKFLIPYIDQNYSTDMGNRLIMGWSAGGFGAMFLFSKHSTLFKAVFSLDVPIVTWEDFVNFQGTRPKIVNNSEYYYEHCSPNEWMARNRNVILEKKDTAIFIAAAMLAPFHQDFLSILKEEEIPFHYREIACDHEFNCVFSESGDDLLIFLSKSLE